MPFNAILAYLYLYVDVLSITHRLEKVFCKATEGTLIIDKIEKGTVRGRSGFSEGELWTITEGEFLLLLLYSSRSDGISDVFCLCRIRRQVPNTSIVKQACSTINVFQQDDRHLVHYETSCFYCGRAFGPCGL